MTAREDTVSEAVAVLVAAYPRQALPADSIRVYVQLLADLPPAELAGAVTRLVKRSQWLPSIAEVRREVAEGQLSLPSASAAYAMVNALCDGATEKQIPEMVWRSIRAIGGTWAFRTSERPDVLRAQFMKHYQEARDEAVEHQMGASRPEPLSIDGVQEAIGDHQRRVVTLHRRAVSERAYRRAQGATIHISPTEEERHDAIRILDLVGSMPFMVGGDLHIEAQRILDDADRWGTHR